jgi:pimeloyl-ACP methyl ester carboxylesterase
MLFGSTVIVMLGQRAPHSEQNDRLTNSATAGARLEVVVDCGHLSTLERPAETSALLGAWLGDWPADARMRRT